MTASTFDRWLVIAALLGGCRAGLPPEPPGRDAADAGARTPKYQPRPNPFETSAFEGVRIDGSSGHEHMNHGGKPMDMPANEHEGMDMPADKPKASERSEAHP